MLWQNQERKALEDVCKRLGIDAKANQDIGQGRGNLSVKEYKIAVQREKVKVDKEMDEYRQKEFSKLEKEIKVLEETIIQEMQLIKEKDRAYKQLEDYCKLISNAYQYYLQNKYGNHYINEKEIIDNFILVKNGEQSDG
jgi:hypothetical protein